MGDEKTQEKRPQWIWVVVLVIAVVVLGYFSLGDGDAGISGIAEGADIIASISEDLRDENSEYTHPTEVFVAFENGKNVVMKSYKVEAKDGVFYPSTLTLEKGDQVQIRFAAVDGEYDVVFPEEFGVHISVDEGEERFAGVDLSDVAAGEYGFSCKDLCPYGVMTGVIVVR